MSADELNRTLASDVPALSRMLSASGRALVFPHGIPYQAAQAKAAEINATVGQLTDGAGQPMALDGALEHLVNVDQELAWLYAPVSGPTPLRKLWLERQRALAGGPDTPTSQPFVTHGLAHAVSLIAALVADPDLDVVLPEPSWENYDLVFELQGGCRMVHYPFFDADHRFNLAGLEAALDRVRGKAVVVLNFPNNPTGYVPTAREMAQIAQLLASRSGPIIALCDDAYQGWVYDEERERKSIFWELAKVADLDRLLPVKIDGATKELVFFSARVGFLTTPLTGRAEAALESKLKCHVRGTVGCPPGPSLALMSALLRDPVRTEASFEARRVMMAGRAAALRKALAKLQSPRLVPYPFHGAFFCLLQYDGDADALRHTLLNDHSAGVISFPETNGIRLAFCSLHDAAIPELVARIDRALS